MIYPATAKGGYKLPIYYDPNSKRPIGIIYKPDAWTASKVYYKRGEDDYDIVIPTVFKGLYFKVKNPGLSGATDPFTGVYVEGDEVTDGTCTWEAVNYNLMDPTESIVTSTWVLTGGVTTTSTSFTVGSTQAKCGNVPAGITEFTATNHTILNSGREDDVTLRVRVDER